jgi:beta-phosphoglucomutase
MESTLAAVIWDVDGTLVDTAELHFQAWLRLAEEIGKPFTRADFTATFGWRNPEIVPKIFGSECSSDEVLAIGDRKELYYRAEASKGVPLLPGVGELVRALTKRGVRQAIGSSAPRSNLELILEMTGLASHFQAVVAMEDVQRGKPNPEVFLRAAERLGVAPRHCMVIEDAPVGIQAAKAAGMRALGVTFVGHHTPESLRAAGADRVVRSLLELSIDDMAVFEVASVLEP